MRHKKIIIALLSILLGLKFVYLPWSDWVDEKQQAIAQLSAFADKQQYAIQNEEKIKLKLEELQQHLHDYNDLLPKLKENEKANTLWFSLIESLKSPELKIYNQKVEFEETVTQDVSFITGSLSISGDAASVMKAILSLESKAPVVFLELLNLNRTTRAQNETLVAQLYIGYWFSQQQVETSHE